MSKTKWLTPLSPPSSQEEKHSCLTAFKYGTGIFPAFRPTLKHTLFLNLEPARTVCTPGSEVFTLSLELNYALSWVSSLPASQEILEVTGLRNHSSQFFIPVYLSVDHSSPIGSVLIEDAD